MDNIEERLIRLEETVKMIKKTIERRDVNWEKFLQHDNEIHERLEQSVNGIRRKINGWYYFALGVAAAGGGILSRWLPF